MRVKSILFIVFALVTATTVLAQRNDILQIPEVDKSEVICFALYTTNNNILKLTAQFYPLGENDPRSCELQINENGEWTTVAKTKIIEPGFTAPFRVENWDMTRDYEYRVAYNDIAFYRGRIKHNPVEKDEIVVAAFTGNSIYPNHAGDIPRTDIVENIKKLEPDVLFFSGDQVYDHKHHYEYWLRFGRDFGEIIKDIPTITIPDDHDVGQGNIWGEGGKKSDSMAGDDGGYFMPVEYVQEVQRAQTSHLPDPFDPTPIQRGISVYYTSLNVGRVSFAIIEDRKWKTGPRNRVPQKGPRPDHYATPDYDPDSLDVPGVVLLGERQLNFLHQWGQDWRGANMKAVLSQTIFCGGAHIHGKVGGRLYADLDSNGWPQTGRNKALAEMRRCFALHIAGDQHLATIFHHGIDDWNDANYSFCVPSIANYYLRWWKPLEPGKNRAPGQPEYLGEFLDGFNNKITLHAVANPSEEPNGGDKLTTRAAGFGVVRFDVKSRKITMECWPRHTDIGNPEAQYEGWPKTIDQLDNYGRKAAAWLPELRLNRPDQVVQVIDEESLEIVYTLRIKGQNFRPKVFHAGQYSIRVGEGSRMKTITNVSALADQNSFLDISL